MKPPREAQPGGRAPTGEGRRRKDGLPAFQPKYDEGLKIGYKWYDAEKKPVLFPFGYGLSYTTYAYSNLRVTSGEKGSSQLYRQKHRQARRRGNRAGLCHSSRKRRRRRKRENLPSAWWDGARENEKLNPGESKREVTVEVDPLFLSIYNLAQNAWQRAGGEELRFWSEDRRRAY